MASMTRLLQQNVFAYSCALSQLRFISKQPATGAAAAAVEQQSEDEEFRVLSLRRTQQTRNKRRMQYTQEVLPPRTNKMPVDQDWSAVWPGPRSFHPASVPLPVRQGFTVKGAAPPAKFANAELMKIPNFLHLTPPAIRQQCEAIKKFCTAWPKGLEHEQQWSQHFPIQVRTTSYCHALPTIRNPEARRVKLTLKLSQLQFDAHARDKFLRLVADRYNADTDELTIVTDRCPLRKQNYDYALYLLTAAYHESFITEPWESTKSEVDMEYYDFQRNKSKQTAEAILNWGSNTTDVPVSEGFAKSVEQLMNDGENEYNLSKYKEQVVKMLGLSVK